MSEQHSDKAALRGEPSYVWRAGQERRLGMIRRAAAGRATRGACWKTAAAWACTSAVWPQTAELAAGLDIELDALAGGAPAGRQGGLRGGRGAALPQQLV